MLGYLKLEKGRDDIDGLTGDEVNEFNSIVDRYIISGEIVWDLWRGRMGLTSEEQIRMAGAARS